MGMCSVQRSLHDSNFVNRCCTNEIEQPQNFYDRHCENMLHAQHEGHFCRRMAKKAECKQEDGATYDGRGCKASVPRIDANSVREPVRHRRPELVSLDLRKHE